jgi:hypothetical protein
MGSSSTFTTGGFDAAPSSASRSAMLDGALVPGEVIRFGSFEFAAS